MPSTPRPYSVWTKLIKLVLNSKETSKSLGVRGSLRITTTRERERGGICQGEIEKGVMVDEYAEELSILMALPQSILTPVCTMRRLCLLSNNTPRKGCRRLILRGIYYSFITFE